MTLWAYPMDSTGCGMYRMCWPLQALAEHRGLDHHVAPPGSPEGFQARLGLKGEVTHVLVPEGCTGLFIQRPTSELLIETLTQLKRALDLPLIVDVDDDMSALNARHPAFHHLHPRSRARMPGHSAQAVHAACDLADLVICSTPALLERYVRRGGRGVVLENRLPRHLAPVLEAGELVPGAVSATPTPHPNTSSEVGGVGSRGAPPHTAPRVGPPPGLPLRVGWPGSIITHPDDLSPALTALHRLHIQPLWTLGPHPNPRHLPQPWRRLPYEPMVFSGRIPFDDWIPAIQTHFDIAIAPLETSRFNQAKSWLKPLEIAAAGVPAVISDTAEYRAFADGSGQPVARKPNDWHRHLRALLNDPAMRDELSLQSMAAAAGHVYDLPPILDEWQAVFAPWCAPKASPAAARTTALAPTH